MFNLRKTYLEKATALSDAASYVWNLRQAKPISAIEIIFEATSNTPDAGAQPLLKDIDNLQVVDGSNMIVSGGGAYLSVIAYALGLEKPLIINSENTTAEKGEARVLIPFGRYVGDKEYYLNPQAFGNLQLKFTTSLTTGAGDWTSGSLKCSIIIHTLEEFSVQAKGYFKHKEIVAQTLAANAEQRPDLPADAPWVNLLLFAENASGVALHPFPTWTNAKLSVNNDSQIPFDIRSRDLLQENISRLGYMAVVEEELEDWAVNQGQGLVVPNITLEGKYAAPYGGLSLKASSPDLSDFYIPSPSDLIKLVLTGGGTGGVVRVYLTQVGH